MVAERKLTMYDQTPVYTIWHHKSQGIRLGLRSSQQTTGLFKCIIKAYADLTSMDIYMTP